jgi:hypothetical protein
MLKDHKNSGSKNPVGTVLLILAAFSIIWIVSDSIRDTTNYESSFSVAGVYLFSLALMVLLGGLVLRQSWSLYPLSILGRAYFILVVTLHIVRGTGLPNTTWFITVGCVLYVGILNELNPLRFLVGQNPLSLIQIGWKLAAFILFFATGITLYSVCIFNLFPEYTYRIQSRQFEELLRNSDTSENLAHAWSDRWRIAVPVNLSPLERNTGIGVFLNRQGEKMIVSDSVWTERLQEYGLFGFEGSYEFEKALWKAGISQPFMLVLKKIMADEKTQAYYMESPSVNAIIILRHNDALPKPSWLVSANIYPAHTAPYNVESTSWSLERALNPMRLTLERYQIRH